MDRSILFCDTFRLLLPFAAKKKKRSIDKLLVEDITPEIIKAFLTELEAGRNCSPSTRNQRLSAVHAFAKFIGLNSPEHVEWCRLVQTIPFKRAKRTLITYLEKSEMDTLLNTPDRKTDQGRRDYALLLFLYNTGARADETAQLKISDLNIATASKKELATVLIRGKGNKPRRCPLWQQTAFELNTIIAQRIPSEYMFLNTIVRDKNEENLKIRKIS